MAGGGAVSRPHAIDDAYLSGRLRTPMSTTTRLPMQDPVRLTFDPAGQGLRA